MFLIIAAPLVLSRSLRYSLFFLHKVMNHAFPNIIIRIFGGHKYMVCELVGFIIFFF